MKTHEDINAPPIVGIHPLRHQQRGAVLIVSLLLLLIMTLIGVTAMSTTSLEEKMAGNMRDKNVALQAAEAALGEAEAWLQPLATWPAESTSCTGTACVWALNSLPDLASQPPGWWQSTAREYGAASTVDIGNVKTDPFYVVDYKGVVFEEDSTDQNGPNTRKDFYRITARGTGGSDDAQAILEITYSRRFN